MPNGMDYSLLQRVIDGTGMILDTEPGTPDDVGTYVTEDQLADWIKGKILFTGYYHNGNFYSDSGHTTLLAKVNGALYIDQTNANKALYVCLSSTYQSLTEEAQVQAIIDGLNDGTIVPLKAKQDQNGNVIDQTYETKADASDLKAAIRKDEARITNLEEKADPTGAYKTVNYRGTNDVPTGKAKYGLVESIVGKSRAWNQLASLQATDWTLSNTSVTSSGNVLTVTPTTNSADTKYALVPIVAGHVYLITGSIAKNANGGASVAVGFFGSSHSVSHVTASNDSATAVSFTELYKTVSGDAYFEIRPSSSMPTSESVNCSKLILRDLTVIFPDLPSTDLVTSNIPNLVKRCPDLLKYDAFGTRMVDTTVEGVKSVGVNIWDEKTESGSYDEYGNEITNANKIRSVNYIPVKGGETYYFMTGVGDVFFYDANKTNIGHQFGAGGSSYTIPVGTCYIRFSCTTAYGTTYNYDIQISEVHGSVSTVNTTYHPYMTDTLTLPSSVTLRSAGSVADTDELNVEVLVDGVKVNKRRQTVRINEVDLGQCDWVYDSYYSVIRTESLTDMSIADNWSALTCAKYTVVSSNTNYTDMPDKSCKRQSISATFVIKDSSITDADIVDYKIAKLVGVKLTYETATYSVTLLEPIQNNTIKTEGGGTINTIQTQTPVIDNSMDVGYLAL